MVLIGEKETLLNVSLSTQPEKKQNNNNIQYYLISKSNSNPTFVWAHKNITNNAKSCK